MCNCFILQCSPCSPWWPFPYLVGVGLVLLLHSFRSRATSWVTPTPAMSSFICWCHDFLGRPRRVVPGIASSITLRVTLVASRLWTCPNQRRRPLRITSSIGERCNMRRISSFRIWSRLDTPRIPRSILISVFYTAMRLWMTTMARNKCCTIVWMCPWFSRQTLMTIFVSSSHRHLLATQGRWAVSRRSAAFLLWYRPQSLPAVPVRWLSGQRE